jgi:nitrate/nitrite transporter NarK
MGGGILSDKIGRVRTFQIGYGFLFIWAIPMFLLIDTGDIVWFAFSLIILASGLGLSYGPQAALYAEMFPAQVRYSGVSIGYALGAILGGAFAPLIAQLLLDQTGQTVSIGIYLMVLAAISFVAVTLVKETRGVPLGVSTHE